MSFGPLPSPLFRSQTSLKASNTFLRMRFPVSRKDDLCNTGGDGKCQIVFVNGVDLSPKMLQEVRILSISSFSNNPILLTASSDVSAFNGSDLYEAVVMPKQSGDPLTLCLTQRQPHPSAHLLPQFDLDPQVSHAKGHTSMPPTNPSSIWSIAETDKEPSSSQTSSSRFNVAAQFLNHGSRSSNIGSTSSCERQGN